MNSQKTTIALTLVAPIPASNVSTRTGNSEHRLSLLTKNSKRITVTYTVRRNKQSTVSFMLPIEEDGGIRLLTAYPRACIVRLYNINGKLRRTVEPFAVRDETTGRGRRTKATTSITTLWVSCTLTQAKKIESYFYASSVDGYPSIEA